MRGQSICTLKWKENTNKKCLHKLSKPDLVFVQHFDGSNLHKPTTAVALLHIFLTIRKSERLFVYLLPIHHCSMCAVCIYVFLFKRKGHVLCVDSLLNLLIGQGMVLPSSWEPVWFSKTRPNLTQQCPCFFHFNPHVDFVTIFRYFFKILRPPPLYLDVVSHSIMKPEGVVNIKRRIHCPKFQTQSFSSGRASHFQNILVSVLLVLLLSRDCFH